MNIYLILSDTQVAESSKFALGHQILPCSDVHCRAYHGTVPAYRAYRGTVQPSN